jgi:hypothetical protein
MINPRMLSISTLEAIVMLISDKMREVSGAKYNNPEPCYDSPEFNTLNDLRQEIRLIIERLKV